MDLLKFRIYNFRNIKDSGWIYVKNMTIFLGAAGSGKTTVFLALLKLLEPKYMNYSTTRGQTDQYMKIDLSKDLPADKKKDEDIDDLDYNIFIDATFSIDKKTFDTLKKEIPSFPASIEDITLSKTLSGKYSSDAFNMIVASREKVIFLETILRCLPSITYLQEMSDIYSDIDLVTLAEKISLNQNNYSIHEQTYLNLLFYLDIWESNLIKTINEVYGELKKDMKEVNFKLIFDKVPLFFNRFKKGFERLNEEFRKWWGDVDIDIVFEPIDRGIRLLIKESSGENFLLEDRSSGFRRFFGLFLTFSVASAKEYSGCLLLIDEAGSTLHASTQERLTKFLHNFSVHNQVMINTNSPFMLPVYELNNTRLVYKDKTGHTVVTRNLSLNTDKSNEEALFPIQAVLSMNISALTMSNCLPVLVLTEADSTYIRTIRNMLFAKGKLKTVYETLIFATGENGIEAIAQTMKTFDGLPIVIVPSSNLGKTIKQRLQRLVYHDEPEKVYELDDFDFTIKRFEDLIPENYLESFSRVYVKSVLGPDFHYQEKTIPFLDQIEEFVKTKNITLTEDFYKKISEEIKFAILRYFDDIRIPYDYLRVWEKIWNTILSSN